MSTAPAGDLPEMVERFRQDTSYPTADHVQQKQLREEWVEKLQPENIESLSRRDLTGVASNGVLGNSRYVYPDVRGVMAWIEALDDASYARMIEHIRYLCWDEDELSIRYNALTDRSSRPVPVVTAR